MPARKRQGRHPEKALTAVRVRHATMPGRYADGNGLYLLVTPSGSKQWVLRTVVKGKRCDVGLGGLSLTSLSEAREEAARLRKVARTGGDPLAERRRARVSVPTFEQAAREVHTAHAAAFRNEKHKAQWLASLAADVFPVFGNRRVDQIESADVLRALSAIWLTKPETARRVRQRIKVVLDWAKASGFRSGDNPVDGVTKVLPKQRSTEAHHAALPYGQLPAFLHALRSAKAGASVKLAFELLILTAARTSEVLRASWNEFDLDGKTWTIPATRIKAGREHRVPLSPRCIEILERVQTLSNGGQYVFPGRTANRPLSNMAFLMVLRRMNRGDLTAHGFRSSFRDWTAEKTNVPRAVAEAALAHVVKNKTEAAYHRTDLFERRRELMQAWSAFVTEPHGLVVRIRA